MKRNHSNSEAFTLVEIVVGLAIIGIMVISLANLFISIGSIQRQNNHLALATRLAEQKIESLRNHHYNALTISPPPLDFTAELSPELGDPKSALVTVSEPNPGMKRLDVVITYHEGSRTKTVSLSALIGNIGISQ